MWKKKLEHVNENYDIFFRSSYTSLYRILKEMDFFFGKGEIRLLFVGKKMM